MTKEEIEDHLRRAFPATVRTVIVEALHTAYYDAQEHWNEAIGCNGSTFGTDVYNFACHRLAKCVDDLGEDASVASRHPAFRLSVGGFDVGCHKVGQSESEPISKCFPQSEFAAGTLASPQLDLFGTTGPQKPSGMVIAHQGSLERGLCAVYMCLPDSINDRGRIDHWGHTELLWKRGQEQSDRPLVGVSLPPVEEVAVPLVRRKGKPA